MLRISAVASRASRGQSRSFFAASGSQSAVPVNEAFPGVKEDGAYAAPSADIGSTTLDNKVRVVSREIARPTTSFGVFINAGSRNEEPYEQGAAAFLSRMAFKSNNKRSFLKNVRDLECAGAMVMAQTSQDSTVLLGECLTQDLETVVEVVSDAVSNNSFDENELKQEKAAMAEEYKASQDNLNALVSDKLVEAAFGFHGLGAPVNALPKNYDQIDSNSLGAFHSKHVFGGRVVVAASGVQHEEFAGLVGKHFGGLAEGPADGVVRAPAVAKYVGGDIRTPADVGETHVAIAFEGAGYNSKDFIPTSILATLMGGGGSFSAGGPGKGLYSRLYLNVLNKYGWVANATTFSSTFHDSGVFGIYGLSLPGHAQDLTRVICDEFKGMAANVTEEELSRAKNQIKSSLLMNLESPSVAMEDIGRQTMVYGKYFTPQELCAQVDAVSAADLTACAKRMLSTPPTVSCAGEVYGYVPRWDEIANMVK